MIKKHRQGCENWKNAKKSFKKKDNQNNYSSGDKNWSTIG